MRLFVIGFIALMISSGCFISQHAEAALGEELIQAVRDGDEEKVSMLLNYGVDVNHANSYGSTALTLAAWNGHTEIVSKLLYRGANVNHVPNDGNTALILAAWSGHTKIVSKLLNRGANINYVTSDGNTALILAARDGHTKTVSMLLNRDADVNYANKHGDTALTLAAWNVHVKTVSKLLQSDVDVNHTNRRGNTALTLAAWNVHPKMVSMLLEHGAKRDSSRYLIPWAGITIDSIYKFQKRKARRKARKEMPKNRALIKEFDRLPPEMRVEIMNHMQGTDDIGQLAKSMRSKLTAEQLMLIYLFKEGAESIIEALKDKKPNAMQLDFIGMPIQLQEAIIKKYDAKLYDRLMKKQASTA